MKTPLIVLNVCHLVALRGYVVSVVFIADSGSRMGSQASLRSARSVSKCKQMLELQFLMLV